MFQRSLQGVALPSSLQPLAFGGFKQSLQGVALLTSLQPLTFGERCDQGFRGVAQPRAACGH
jgi:hypothetical protein